MRNRERFAQVYAEKLAAAVKANPAAYVMYYESTVIRPNVGPPVTIAPATVERTVERMMAALARGNVSLAGNPTLAATLKALGVPRNIKSARAFLNEEAEESTHA